MPSGKIVNNKEKVFSQFEIQNLGPVNYLKSGDLGMVNLFIGENSCGKTYAMKLLYAVCKVIENYRREKDASSLIESMKEKLYWLFQAESLSDIVNRFSDSPMRASFTLANQTIEMTLTKEGAFQLSEQERPSSRALEKINSLFLPAKEVLSNHRIIVSARDDNYFGFDDSYCDLAKVLQHRPTMGKNYANFTQARALLADVCRAKPNYDGKEGVWKIRKDGQVYAIGEVSEGIKKLSIMDILLGNRYLKPGSVVFIDEPESALHPSAISTFMDAITSLADAGMQFFLSSHSYFVLRKLENIAISRGMSIPTFSFQDNRWNIVDLKDGLPDNPIVNESIKLYYEHLNN